MRSLTKALGLATALMVCTPLSAVAHNASSANHHDTSSRHHTVRYDSTPRSQHRQERFANDVAHRLERQWHRIRHGVRSGQLTRREAKRLKRQHRSIEGMFHHFAHDGRYSRWERRELVATLNHASERIRWMKHNDRVRWNKHRSSH